MRNQKELKKIVTYNPETGVMLWRERPVEMFQSERDCKTWNNRYFNTPVGSICEGGYVRTEIQGKKYRLHRLVWLYVYGGYPPSQIDHINCIRDDNRIANLRAVSHQENCNKRKENRHRVVGVDFDKVIKRWVTTLPVEGVVVRLGEFLEKDDAIASRKQAMINMIFKIKRRGW